MDPAQQPPVPMVNTNGAAHSSNRSPAPSLASSSIDSKYTEVTVGSTINHPIPYELDVYNGNPEELEGLMVNVPGMKDDPSGSRSHLVLTLQKNVPPCDLPYTKMWLREGPNGEQVLVTQEPSMSGVFHKVGALYAGREDSDQAKRAFETKRKIDADLNRHYRYRSYHVIGCKLNNSIFSGNGNNGLVNREVKLSDFKYHGFQLKATVAEWTIALNRDGLEKVAMDTDDDDLSALKAQWNA